MKTARRIIQQIRDWGSFTRSPGRKPALSDHASVSLWCIQPGISIRDPDLPATGTANALFTGRQRDSSPYDRLAAWNDMDMRQEVRNHSPQRFRSISKVPDKIGRRDNGNGRFPAVLDAACDDTICPVAGYCFRKEFGLKIRQREESAFRQSAAVVSRIPKDRNSLFSASLALASSWKLRWRM